jgi:thiosulfate dehydrogenase (quinone) large subunit
MSGRRSNRRRPRAAETVRVVERRPGRTGARHSAPSSRPLGIQRMTEWEEWLWLGPPPQALHLAGWAVLPLRAFLGFTFCFAGLQKLANPGFFSASNPSSIQSQLAGAARRSPIHGLIAPLAHVAVPLGLFIAFAELAAGLGAILGLWTRIAALGGILISFGLFLTVSFHSNPYYTGSDIVFVFAWTALLLGGSGGVLAVDGLLTHIARKQEGFEPTAVVPVPFEMVQQVCGSYANGRCQARDGEACAPGPCPYLARRPTPRRQRDEATIDRRALALKGAWTALAAAVGLLGGGLGAGIGRLASSAHPSGTTPLGVGASPTSPSSTNTTTTPAAPQGATPTSSSSPKTTSASTPRPSGTRLGPATAVPVGSAASFQDPASGDPSVVIQPVAGRFLAFDTVCPHAGCVVQYDQGNKVFVCPCHGSMFNGQTGAVENGPAPTGLRRITIKKGPDGQLYAT